MNKYGTKYYESVDNCLDSIPVANLNICNYSSIFDSNFNDNIYDNHSISKELSISEEFNGISKN